MENNKKTAPAVSARLAQRWWQRTRHWVKRAPGGDFLVGQAQAIETLMVQHLQERMQHLDSAPLALPGIAQVPTGDSIAERMALLMEHSLNQTPDSARYHFYQQLVEQLVPDEARLLTALSDGTPVPVCHLEAVPRLLGDRHRVLSFLSRIGHESGAMLTDQVPCYLQHLMAMGLLQTRGEDTKQNNKYETIENDSEARKAFDEIEKNRGFKPRFIRQAVQLSATGQQFWQACTPS